MTTIEMTPAKKIARLTARQQYQLAEAVKQQEGRFRKERPTVAEAAEEFTRTLGFPVGSSSVRTAMEAAGATWDTSGRAKQPNRINLDVSPAYTSEPGPARLRFEPVRRPGDERLCGVTVPRDVPPAESAAWLRRVADLLDRHGTELQAVDMYENDDTAVVEEDEGNYGRVQAGWAAILAATAV